MILKQLYNESLDDVVVTFGVLRTILVQDADVAADAAILVKNGVLDHAGVADREVGHTEAQAP